MASYEVFQDATEAQQRGERPRRHHDHLKTLEDCYAFMRQKETYDRVDRKFKLPDCAASFGHAPRQAMGPASVDTE